MEAWLRVHDIEETTRQGYESYARLYLYPAFGDEPVGRITARVWEELYAELRRCRDRCDGRPQVGGTIIPRSTRMSGGWRPSGRAGRHPPSEAAGERHRRYSCTPNGNGTDVTESFRLHASLPARGFWAAAQRPRHTRRWSGPSPVVEAASP